MITKIFFINSWHEDPVDLLKRYSKQTPNMSGKWKDIQGVSRIEDADYYVILGGQKTDFGLDKEKTLYVKREPDMVETLPNKVGPSIAWNDKHCGITWWVNKSYDQLKNLKYSNEKSGVSCIASSKHAHRLSFIRRMSMVQSEVDLYGRGHLDYGHNGVYKGELNYDGNCKISGLYPYQYTVVLENSQEKNYWTEKLADAYLSWCMPIYWGCPNIDEFFNKESYHSISIDDPDPARTISKISQTPLSIENIKAIEESRNKILERYNIWEVVRRELIDKNE